MDIIKELKEDKELYYGYQANIAMAFMDTYRYYKKNNNKKYINNNDLHIISNDAAKKFLNLLIKE